MYSIQFITTQMGSGEAFTQDIITLDTIILEKKASAILNTFLQLMIA